MGNILLLFQLTAQRYFLGHNTRKKNLNKVQQCPWTKVTETGVGEDIQVIFSIQILQARLLEICGRNSWSLQLSRDLSRSGKELLESIKQKNDWGSHSQESLPFPLSKIKGPCSTQSIRQSSLKCHTLIVGLKQPQSKGCFEPVIIKLKIKTQKDQTDSNNFILASALSNVFQHSTT